MTIKKDILTVNVTPNGMREVRGLVLHSMWGTYQGSIAWFKNPQSQASCHYLISKNGEIAQMAEHSTMTWHAGVYDTGKCPEWAIPNPNWFTIGIEFEDERNANWVYPEKQRIAGQELVAQLIKQYSIPRERILLHRHLNPSRRTDPVGSFSFDWLLPPPPPPAPQPSGPNQEHINWNFVLALCSELGLNPDPSNKEKSKQEAVQRIKELKQGAASSGEVEKYRQRLDQLKELANRPV